MKQQSESMAFAADIDYQSDDEPPLETIQDRMLWRLDPDESKSDWTIEIIVKHNKTENKNDGIQHVVNNDNATEDDSATVQTYHVHVRDLTVGPRRSEYFVQMLRDGGRFAESQTKTSCIELHELAAEAFPMLLDFVYSTGASVDSIPFTTNNATALYSLAKYFGIRSLRSLAKNFWTTDIQRSMTCETYYEHATMLQEEKILQTATHTCATNIMQLKTSSPLLHVAYVKFWLDIGKKIAAGSNAHRSLHLSRLLAHFFQQNNTVETDVFLKLTSNALLPKIHKDAAIYLLDAERRILSMSNRNGIDDKQQRVSEDLTNLQERCIQSILSNWNDIDLDENSPAVQLLNLQSSFILARLFAGTVSKAQSDNKTLKRQYYTDNKELKRKYKSLKSKYSDSSDSDESEDSDSES